MRWRVGDVVGIAYRGVQHQGLVTVEGDDDTARVIHNSKRRGFVTEESADVFRAGRRMVLVARSPSPDASVAYARACTGRPWRHADNCQTFTREAVGLALPSPDASRIGWAAVGLSALVAVLGARWRLR